MNPVNGVATAHENLSNFWGKRYLEEAQSIEREANPYFTDGCRPGEKAVSYFHKAGYTIEQFFRQCSFAQRPIECSQVGLHHACTTYSALVECSNVVAWCMQTSSLIVGADRVVQSMRR